MNSTFLKDYKTLVAGAILTSLLAVFMSVAGVIILDVGQTPSFVFTLINILAFILCWVLLAFLIHRYSIYKISALMALLFIVGIADYFIATRNNPLTIPLLILFWLGVASMILPQFFKKYQVLILSVYGLVISYFLIDFVLTPNYAPGDRLNFSSFMLSPIPVFAALWAYEQWRWLRTLKADKAKAELTLLKNQINPHFFFNTLNNLYGLVVEQSEKAPEVILKLSDMMRYTIYKGKEDFVSLSEELIYLENYIELHKLRYQMQVDFRFTKQIAEDYEIAPLLFINLLENAIKHGVESKMKGAYVWLDLKAAQKQVTFMIENNFESSNVKKTVGIGLENLKKRLDHLYPDQYQLEINKQSAIFQVQLTIKLP